jgi:hypothetical protein
MLPFSKLELLSEMAPSSVLPLPHSDISMQPEDTRADLGRRVLRKRAEKMVAQYVRLEFSMRSAAGRMVIDETRLFRRQRVEIDLEIATMVEVLDAIHSASIRRAVFTPPAAPIVRNEKGAELRRVMSAKDVAQIVRLKSMHGHHPEPTGDVREWCATVAQKLARLPKDERYALLEIPKIREHLVINGNQLCAARSESGRLKRGARYLRRNAEARVAELRSREAMLGERRDRLIRSRAYRIGLDHLVLVCTETADIEAYCFGEE